MFICTPAFERETIRMSTVETNKHVKNKNVKDKIMAVDFFVLLNLFSQILENEIYIPHVMKQIVMTLTDPVAML